VQALFQQIDFLLNWRLVGFPDLLTRDDGARERICGMQKRGQDEARNGESAEARFIPRMRTFPTIISLTASVKPVGLYTALYTAPYDLNTIAYRNRREKHSEQNSGRIPFRDSKVCSNSKEKWSERDREGQESQYAAPAKTC
jgi:hypothetical protein